MLSSVVARYVLLIGMCSTGEEDKISKINCSSSALLCYLVAVAVAASAASQTPCSMCVVVTQPPRLELNGIDWDFALDKQGTLLPSYSLVIAAMTIPPTVKYCATTTCSTYIFVGIVYDGLDFWIQDLFVPILVDLRHGVVVVVVVNIKRRQCLLSSSAILVKRKERGCVGVNCF